MMVWMTDFKKLMVYCITFLSLEGLITLVQSDCSFQVTGTCSTLCSYAEQYAMCLEDMCSNGENTQSAIQSNCNDVQTQIYNDGCSCDLGCSSITNCGSNYTWLWVLLGVGAALACLGGACKAYYSDNRDNGSSYSRM